MRIRLLVYAVVLTCCALLLSRQGRAQGQLEFRTPGNDSIKVVLIQNTDNYRFQTVDSATSLTLLVGNVKLKQENTIIYCDSMVRNSKDNILECFGHVHINDNDSTNIFSDYMKYQVDTRMVYFNKNVKLTDGKGVLTTEELQYDLKNKVGVYTHGGKIVNKESVLTSQEGTYFEDTKDVHFKNNVVLRDPQYDLSADSLLYNTQTQVSTFITETFIQFKDSTHRTVRTKDGFYDLRNRKAYFGKRPVMTEGSQQVTGETVLIDDSTGINTARGNAIYKDSVQGFVLHADYMTINKKTNTFLATEHPLMTLKQDKDSIYIVADTLISGRLIDAQVVARKMEISDSLHQIYVDSIYRVSSDSLHRAAAKDTLNEQDTLLSVTPDSSHREVMKDLSDSLGGKFARGRPPVPRDSLAVADSLHGKSGAADSLQGKPSAADSLGHRPGAGLDSLGKKVTDTSKKKLTPKEERRKERELEQSQRDQQAAQKAAQKATADSIKQKIKTTADSISRKNRAVADSISHRARIVRDSLTMASRPRTPKQLRADSLYKVRQANKQRRVDSLRMDSVQRNTADSLQRRAADSLHKHVSDSLQKRAADSIRAIKVEEATITDTSLRYIQGYHHVRIFSDSLQAVGDSLYYSAKDSIFRLFYNPIAWGNGNYQVTGDTMYVYTKNKKANRLYVFENAIAINKVGRQFYNQLKGTTINAYFKNGEVDFMRAKGNAESIYYVKDDNKAYTGVNKAHADIIDMIFALKDDSSGRELNRVVMRNDVEGSFIPFRKVNFEDMVLRGFKWHEDLRPKSKEDLMKPLVNKKDQEEADLLITGPEKGNNNTRKEGGKAGKEGNNAAPTPAGPIKADPPATVDPLPINPHLLPHTSHPKKKKRKHHFLFF
jgi:lipopolysaccharide export system protein LptA